MTVEVAEDLVAGGDDRVGHALVHRAELEICLRRGALEEDERADQLGMRAQSADRIVLDRALRLRAVERVIGDGDFAERVFFEPNH